MVGFLSVAIGVGFGESAEKHDEIILYGI